jgi:small subunit ribosomal protein S18
MAARRPRRAARGRKSVKKKKRSRHLDGVTDIDPQDFELARRFLTDHGKIIPARLTGATARQQRQIRRAVRRARVMGLAP